MIQKTSKAIYMDYHATTPVDPRVLESMLPYFGEKFGNAASRTHRFGEEARLAVEKARTRVAALVGASAREIVFTSGATESNNLAIKGTAMAYRQKGDHLVTVETEHKSVLDPFKRLSMQGFRVTYLPVNRGGLLDPKELERVLTRKTILISVMLANNETGVIQPVAEVGRIARAHGIIFHCDAAQGAGKIPVEVKALSVDLLSFTAHKLCGPKGVGALYVRKSEPRVRLLPLLDGGGHEVGLRSGTLNVPGIVGFGKACEISRREMPKESKRLRRLRDRMEKELLKGLDGCFVNGNREKRLPNSLNISFSSANAQRLVKRLAPLALSTGSACTSASPEPSYVLKAMGVPEKLRKSAIRFGLGRFTTAKEVRQAVGRVVQNVKRLRQ